MLLSVLAFMCQCLTLCNKKKLSFFEKGDRMLKCLMSAGYYIALAINKGKNNTAR